MIEYIHGRGGRRWSSVTLNQFLSTSCLSFLLDGEKKDNRRKIDKEEREKKDEHLKKKKKGNVTCKSCLAPSALARVANVTNPTGCQQRQKKTTFLELLFVHVKER